MNTQDLGEWVRYTPDPWPEKYPSNAMFSHRKSDGMDWYTFACDMAADTIKATVDDTLVIQAVSFDASRLFPQNCRLIEISGADATTEEDAFTAFHGKLYDPTTGTISDPLVIVQPLRVAASSAKLVLDDDGLYSTVEGICRNHPVLAVRIFWESANTWVEDNAYVLAIGTELNLSAEQMHDMFVRAMAK